MRGIQGVRRIKHINTGAGWLYNNLRVNYNRAQTAATAGQSEPNGKMT